MRFGLFYRCGVIALVFVLACCGCAERRAQPGGDAPGQGASPADAGQVLPGAEETPREGADASGTYGDIEMPESGQSYIAQVAQQVADGIAEPDMGEYERAKAAFDYMIANTSLLEPVGLDLWRMRGDENQPQPSFVENRSLSVLLFGAGMCEDYAAAFTMILRAMGLEAEYVPGLTYSTEGALVDHAWVVAKIDGTWYHLDCQLEDNISRNGAIRYRYFMKSDATLGGSHRWGQNLIDAGLLSAAQNREVADHYLMPACPQDYAPPPRQSFVPEPEPDLVAIRAEIETERRAYEEANGPLAPMELDIIPPVFAQEGYGPPD